MTFVRLQVAAPIVAFKFALDAWQTETRDALFARAIDMAGGNQTKAAKLLGVTPQAVSKWGRER